MTRPLDKEYLLEELVRVGAIVLERKYEHLGDKLIDEGLADKIGIEGLMSYRPTAAGISRIKTDK